MKNTEEYVSIYLESVQSLDGKESKTKFCTQGKFYQKNGAFYLTYEQSGEDDEKAHYFLKISQKSVTMRRMGSCSYVMEFIDGTEAEFSYKTPYGDIKMQLETVKTVNELSENGGALKIFYSLFMGGEEIKNELTLEVKLRSGEDEV